MCVHKRIFKIWSYTFSRFFSITSFPLQGLHTHVGHILFNKSLQNGSFLEPSAPRHISWLRCPNYHVLLAMSSTLITSFPLTACHQWQPCSTKSMCGNFGWVRGNFYLLSGHFLKPLQWWSWGFRIQGWNVNTLKHTLLSLKLWNIWIVSMFY